MEFSPSETRNVDSLPTPSLVIDSQILRRNIVRMAEYARAHKLALRPHTKTHKSLQLARMQISHGASGLTVAKAGEAEIMAQTGADILLAYPTVDRARSETVARLARSHSIRVALDSVLAARSLSEASSAASAVTGVLIDIDVGLHRTGVQSPAAALALAQEVQRLRGIRLDGLFFYPGHIGSTGHARIEALAAVDSILEETLDLWRRSGLEAKIVSGGSTPTALESHRVTRATEIRPGTYVFNDMNCVSAGCATLDDCAARIICTVVSDAVPGQIVVDAGTKTLTSDRCGPSPDSGHGLIVEYPKAKIAKLTEEHGQVDITQCERAPRLGERVSIIPNHICPCVNLQDKVWINNVNAMKESQLEAMQIDTRGKVQ